MVKSPARQRWDEANRERLRQAAKERYQANREARRAQVKAYRDANREKILAKNKTPERKAVLASNKRAWNKANPEKRKAKDRSYYERNSSKISAKNKEWKAANREKVLAFSRKHCAKTQQSLPPSRVASYLGLPVTDLTPELLELKRQQLALHRLGRELKEAIVTPKEIARKERVRLAQQRYRARQREAALKEAA